MRGLMIGLSVLLLAAGPVLGQNTATISITTPGAVYDPTGNCLDPGQPANVIDCNDVATPFYLDIEITCSDTGGMSAFGITLDSNCELGYLAMENAMGNILNYCGQYTTYSSRSGMTDQNWSQADGAELAAGTLPMAGPTVGEEVGTICEGGDNPTYALDGLAAWLVMDPLDCEGFVCCCIDEGLTAYVGDSEYQPCDLTVIPLCITPEPASALLLLLGLPFLPRRR